MTQVNLAVGDGKITFQNANLSLVFQQLAGWQLVSFKNTGTGHEFIAQNVNPGALWKLQALVEYYRKVDVVRIWENDVQQEKVEVDSTTPCKFDYTRHQEGEATILTLDWRGVTIAEETNAADISVEITMSPDSEYSEWRLNVAMHSPRIGVWRVDFPIVGPLAASETAELVVPNGWGQLIPNPSQSKGYHGHFPCGTCDLQAANLNDAGSGLYLAAHDPKGNDKEIAFDTDPAQHTLAYRLISHPTGMGTVSLGQPYVQPYAAAVGAYRGDWLTGAKMYRKWLPNAVWWPRESMAKREETPEWIKETALWILTGGFAKDVVPQAKAFAAFFDVPIALHWYSWHEIPFDDHYPEYFPTKPGFAEGVRELREAGVKVMPYINGRLWDPRNDSWRLEKVATACAKDAQGLKYVEVYASHVALAVMCPTTELWQNKISSTVQRLISECGVNAVYIDQISAAPAKLCFDAGHPHAPGGGDFWVGGYRELLTRTRAAAKAADAQAMLTTEDAAEPFADLLDAFLMCNSTRDQLIPFYPAVYSGRSLTFGRYVFNEDIASLEAFATKVGQMFVFGAQLGWLGTNIMEDKYREQAAYLKRLAKIRHAATQYMAMGELVGFPKLTPPSAVIDTCWYMMNAAHDFAIEPLIPVQLPKVMGSVWRADDGSLGVVLTNMGDTLCEFSWSLDIAKCGSPVNGRVHIRRLDNGLYSDFGDQGSAGVQVKTSLAPLDAQLFIVE
jgi:hypothetical protein